MTANPMNFIHGVRKLTMPLSRPNTRTLEVADTKSHMQTPHSGIWTFIGYHQPAVYMKTHL